MDLQEAQALLRKYGWTPQILHRSGLPYLYAAQWARGKTHWRYISAASKVEQLTEQDIVDKLQRKKQPPNPYKIYA